VVIFIVGFVDCAVKLYHTSLFEVPQALPMAVYVAPTKVPAVPVQLAEEVSGTAAVHKSCAPVYLVNREKISKINTILQLRRAGSIIIFIELLAFME
jgi:hypothetical protein